MASAAAPAAPRVVVALPAALPSAPVRLTNNDITMPPSLTRIIALYAAPADGTDALVERIVAGWHALVACWPLAAARLMSLPGGRWFAYWPGDASGAPLTVQRSAATLAALAAAGFTNAAMPAGLAPDTPFLEKPGDPPVCGHVTILADGALAVSLTTHHFLCDGHGSFSALRMWADLSLGLTPLAAMLPLPDIETRAALDALADGIAPGTHPEYRVTDATAPAPTPAASPPWSPPPMTAEYLAFDTAALARLKADATLRGGEEGPRISTNDALSSLLWRAVTRARGLEGDTPTACGFACNCRERFRPALPPSYWGNVNFFPTIWSDAATITGEGGLAGTAAMFRAATDRMDDAYARSALAWVAAQPDKSAVAPAFSPYLSDDAAFTNWTRFDMYAIDFGAGAPVRVRLPPSKFDGLGIMLPLPPSRSDAATDATAAAAALASPVAGPVSGGIEVFIGLRSDHWARLCEDEELRHYLTRGL